MTQRTFGPVFTRKSLLVGIGALLAAVVMNFTSDTSVMAKGIKAALAMYEADHGRFPRKATFNSDDGTTYPGAGVPTEMLSLDLIGPTDLAQLPILPALGGSAQMNGFFDVFTELSVDGLAKPYSDISPGQFRIIGADGGGGGGGGASWPIELTQLNLALGGQIRLRESPTKQSLGHYALTPLSTGVGYMADGFFDVFTEISLDGGATWNQAASSVRMNLTSIVPEPGSIALALVALGGCAFSRRRR